MRVYECKKRPAETEFLGLCLVRLDVGVESEGDVFDHDQKVCHR